MRRQRTQRICKRYAAPTSHDIPQSLYGRRGRAAIMRDADDYLDVFVESFRYSDAPVVCTVSESLADVYQALRNMVETFRSEIDEAMEVALFDCLEDFKLRWGQLLLGATRAIHELIASGQTDEL